MDQGSNFKKEVMEALFNAPTNLITTKAIKWAASNLPDEGGMGTHSTKFNEGRGDYDHNNESFWRAIGMQEDEPDTVSNKVRDAILEICTNSSEGRKSMILEHIEKKCGYEGMLFLATKGFFECLEQLEEAKAKAMAVNLRAPGDLDDLIKELEALRKKLGGDQ